MKVLMVTDVFPNHVNPNLGTFSLERLKTIQKMAEVKVVAAVPYFPSWGFLKGFKKWHDYSRVKLHEVVEGTDVYHPRRVVIPKVGGASSGYFYYRTLKNAFGKIAGEFKYDVIDAHFIWPDGYAALRAGKEMGVPVCITAHGTDVNLMPDFPSIRPLIAKTIKGADRIIAVSGALAEIVKSLGGVDEKVRVIHNGVDITKFKRIDRDEARNEIGVDGGAKVLISIGALIPRKGHEYLIDGVDMLVNGEGMKDIQLLILGKGESQGALEERIRTLNLEKHVRLVGPVPHMELYRWLSASDFFCLTSSREGWPTVFFESWACGVPVLATAVHGAPEAICSDAYGLLIDRQDPALVAEAIKKAMDMKWDPGVMMDYAAANTWERLSQDIYGELLSVVEDART